MKGILHFEIFLFLFYVEISTISINNTSTWYVIMEEAKALIGNPTAQFPKEAFLNYILYGRTDLPFLYSDFLNSFGNKTSDFYWGNIIIGNDAKLCGIVIDENSISIPIPGSLVTLFPSTQFSKYFPSGYTILTTIAFYVLRKQGSANSTFNNNNVCSNNCGAALFTSNNDSNLFLENNFFEIDIDMYYYTVSFYFNGYLSKYYSQNNSGIIQVDSYGIRTTDNYKFYFADLTYQNEILFDYSVDCFKLSGLVKINYLDKVGIFNMTATLYDPQLI